MNNNLTRRNFIRCGALTAATLASANNLIALAQSHPSPDAPSPIRLGIASYTFRNFTRAQMIANMQQLKISALNTKDVKDHLPVNPQEEKSALAEYAAAGITIHAAGVIYFDKDEDTDMRNKFEYCKRAGIKVIVAGPSPETLPRLEKFVKEYDMQIAIHNHGPEDKLWPSPLDVLKAVNGMDPRLGCCIDVGHTVRAGTDVLQAIHAAGPRLFNLHMKDLTNLQDKESQVAVGDGKMPVKEIFQTLSVAYMRRVLSDMRHSSQG
jgi:sugar phosphate isomerase/epimerase